MSSSQGAIGHVILGIVLVIGGCCINNIALELLIKEDLNPWADKKSGTLLTTLQFICIALSALPYVAYKNALLSPTVPHWAYVGLAALSGTMSYLNNLAFAYNISQPTHMVFRTSGLLVSMLVGVAFFSKSYSLPRVLAVGGVTVGASLCTVAEVLYGDTATAAAAVGEAGGECCGRQLEAVWAAAAAGEGEGVLAGLGAMQTALTSNAYSATWLAGVGVLVATVCVAGFLGHTQSALVSTWGRAAQEGIFYTHAIPLTVMLTSLGPTLMTQADVWSASPPLATALPAIALGRGGAGVEVGWVWEALPPAVGALPIMWAYAALNVLSQWVCIQGVFQLTGSADAVTVTFVMTVRKFLSLLISVVLFGNTFTSAHWVASALVFGSAALYGLAPVLCAPRPKEKRE